MRCTDFMLHISIYIRQRLQKCHSVHWFCSCLCMRLGTFCSLISLKHIHHINIKLVSGRCISLHFSYLALVFFSYSVVVVVAVAVIWLGHLQNSRTVWPLPLFVDERDERIPQNHKPNAMKSNGEQLAENWLVIKRRINARYTMIWREVEIHRTGGNGYNGFWLDAKRKTNLSRFQSKVANVI